LDYCSSVCNPYYSKDIELLERVQHRFTRLFSELRSLPYEIRLCQLGLWPLEGRRNRTDLIEVFKLVKCFSRTAWNEFFHQPDNAVIRGHSRKLAKNYSHCNSSLQFFYQRVINRWNSSSLEDIEVSSVNAFKGRLGRLRHHQIDFFLKTASLQVLPAARLPTDIDAELTLRRIKGGAAAPGELPGGELLRPLSVRP